MSDNNRIYPVNKLIMHHAVSDFMVNWNDLKIQDWFDKVGKARGYSKRTRSYHQHPSRNKETFTMAHYCLHEHTTDKNKYGWRLTLLLKDPWNNVCWHASNWKANQTSIGIETAGNYLNKKLPEKALMLLADFWRKHDQSLKGKTFIQGHKQYFATACPGQIYNQLETIIDMINNPDKWNKKLFPKPKEKPLYRCYTGDKIVVTNMFRNNTKENLKDAYKGTNKVTYNGHDITAELWKEIEEEKPKPKPEKPKKEEKPKIPEDKPTEDETEKTVKENNHMLKWIIAFIKKLFKH